MRKEIIALSIVFLIIILGSIFFSQVGKRATPLELVPHRSTYNSAPTGCKALYLLLQELGFETSRWQFPIQKLAFSSSPTRNLLITIDPQTMRRSCSEGMCTTDPETETLLSWVRKGGHLLLIDDDDQDVVNALDLKIEKTQELWEAEGQPLFPLLPTAYLRKVREIGTRGSAHLSGDIPPKAIVHLEDENGPVLLSQNLGQGHITIFTNPYTASNQGLDKGDNVILLTNIIVKEGVNRTILFDEYHHGYDSSLSLLGYYRNTPVAWISLQILFLGIALFYTLSRRFGKPQPLRKEESRSILEYIKSMASLAYKADLQSSITRSIYLRYKNLWIKRFGLSPTITTEELGSLISARANLNQKRFFETILTCEKVCRKEIKLERGQFLHLIRNLEKARRKIDGQS